MPMRAIQHSKLVADGASEGNFNWLNCIEDQPAKLSVKVVQQTHLLERGAGLKGVGVWLMPGLIRDHVTGQSVVTDSQQGVIGPALVTNSRSTTRQSSQVVGALLCDLSEGYFGHEKRKGHLVRSPLRVAETLVPASVVAVVGGKCSITRRPGSEI